METSDESGEDSGESLPGSPPDMTSLLYNPYQ